MRIIRDIRTSADQLFQGNAPDITQGTALTIGNFDGCHRGHVSLIQGILASQTTDRLQSCAMTFEPAPEQFFNISSGAMPRLFTGEQKLQAFSELGLDVAVVESFDQGLADLSHTAFFQTLLCERLAVRRLIIGYDFHFGKGRKGNATYLEDACRSANIDFQTGDRITYNGEPISSTRIRQAIMRGSLAAANDMLGRPYLLTGQVVKGDQKGRHIGFPTANLGGYKQCIPRNGVYCGYLSATQDLPIFPWQTNGSLMPCVINIGVRPTVSNQDHLRIEAHCFADEIANDALYGLNVGIYFVARLRDEIKFASLEELTQAISADIVAARLKLDVTIQRVFR